MGLLKTAGRAAVASSVHGRVQRRQQQRWAAQDAAVAQAQWQPVAVAPVAAAPIAQPAEDQLVTQLRQLGELRDSGILTEDEFTAKKAKLLGI